MVYIVMVHSETRLEVNLGDVSDLVNVYCIREERNHSVEIRSRRGFSSKNYFLNR